MEATEPLSPGSLRGCPGAEGADGTVGPRRQETGGWDRRCGGATVVTLGLTGTCLLVSVLTYKTARAVESQGGGED